MMASVSFDMVLLQELIAHAEHCLEADIDILLQRSLGERGSDDDRLIQSCRICVAWYDLLQGLKDCRR